LGCSVPRDAHAGESLHFTTCFATPSRYMRNADATRAGASQERLSELRDLKVVAGERVVEDFARVARHCTPLDSDERWMRGVCSHPVVPPSRLHSSKPPKIQSPPLPAGGGHPRRAGVPQPTLPAFPPEPDSTGEHLRPAPTLRLWTLPCRPDRAHSRTVG
jgi:hypothetical protein